MKKLFVKKIMAFVMLFMLSLPMVAVTVSGANADQAFEGNAEKVLWGETGNAAKVQSGMGNVGNKDPRETIASAIKIVLGFLGIIAVVIIVLGGFKWMTSMGSEEKTEEARNMITAGVIGLLIILSAYGIAVFVTNQLFKVTTETI